MSLKTFMSLDFWMGVLLIFAIFLTIYFFIYWRKR